MRKNNSSASGVTTAQAYAASPIPTSSARQKLLSAWGIEIDDALLIQALTHRSFSHENPGLQHNERLEYLGDAVLELIVTEKLFRAYPEEGEGALTKMRQAVVSRPALASVARDLNLGEYILLGRGEMRDGRNKDSLLSNAVEAMIGATYMCHGFETTRVVVEKLLAKLLENAYVRGAVVDYKTILQQMCQALKQELPVYQSTFKGPDHARRFKSIVLMAGQELGLGRGTSKKQAEHEAAKASVEILRERHGITEALGYEAPSVEGETNRAAQQAGQQTGLAEQTGQAAQEAAQVEPDFPGERG